MSLLDKMDLDAVNAAIQNAEKRTDAELVAVLARQADDYRYIPTLWAALIALLVPGVIWLSGWWLETLEILLAQLGVFVALALVLRIPAIMFRIIPRTVRHWRAANLARRQFLDNNLHHTVAESGVLIFISEAEHYAEIIADRGIDQHVSAQHWQSLLDKLIGAIQRGETQRGLIECIDACGALLAQHVPASREKNELPNHLVII